MPDLVRCQVDSGPAASQVGGVPRVYEYVWVVQSDNKIDAWAAVEKGRAVSGAGFDTIPALGAPLNITIQGENRSDPAAFAMEFYPTRRGTADNIYDVRVIYRPPRVGQLEDPAEINKLATDRLPEAFFEDRTVMLPQQTGYLWSFSGGSWTEAGTQTTLQLANSEALDHVQVAISAQVLVLEYEVNDPLESSQLNGDFAGTVNDKDVILHNVSGFGSEEVTYKQRHLMYLSCRQSRRYNKGWETWTIQVRFVIHPGTEENEADRVGWVERWRNAGRYYLDAPLGNPDHGLTKPGIARSGPFDLNQDGTEYDGTQPKEETERRYRVLRNAAYEAMPWFKAAP